MHRYYKNYEDENKVSEFLRAKDKLIDITTLNQPIKRQKVPKVLSHSKSEQGYKTLGTIIFYSQISPPW